MHDEDCVDDDKEIYFLIYSRLLSRILFIPFANVTRNLTEDQDASWNKLFVKILAKVSSMVGDVIRIGQWASTPDGTKFYQECLGIVVKGFGDHGKGTRFSKMWACAMLATRKVSDHYCTLILRTF
jgi:hypothetical protein